MMEAQSPSETAFVVSFILMTLFAEELELEVALYTPEHADPRFSGNCKHQLNCSKQHGVISRKTELYNIKNRDY
jgi:hypothetical protein